MLTEKEQKVLKQLLKEGEKREKSCSYRYFVFIGMAIVILMAILFLTIGIIFKADEMIIMGLWLTSIGIGGSVGYIGKLRKEKILYNAIKKIYQPDEILSNNSNSGCALLVLGIGLMFGGVMMAFRDELMYLSTGAKFFLKPDPFDIPFKIIGFSMAGIGLLIIIIPPIIRRWRGY